ncbi:DUF4168 domain-containing protein [Phormidium tenue FACHB-886]|nr:DUF4168 domain-containing protein [Phormidium tenue FACHB-886]
MITALRSMFPLSLNAAKPPRWLARSLWVGAFSAAGLLLGWVPTVQVSGGQSLSEAPSEAFVVGLSFDSAAHAQSSISDTEIRSYAQTVLEMEPYRISAYDEIKRITGSEVPPILCHRASSLNSLDPSIRDIAINFCNQAVSIAESHNLSITRFNEITIAQQSDGTLANRIREVIREIQ